MDINLDVPTFESWREKIFGADDVLVTPSSDITLVYADLRIQLNYVFRLFGESSRWISKIQAERVKKGLTLLTDGWNQFIVDLLTNDSLELGERCNVIRSMKVLFEEVFTNDIYKDISFMWWDVIIGTWYGNPTPQRILTEKEEVLRDAYFETMLEILKLNNKICQLSALHGIGHLQHPRTREVIHNYLVGNRPEWCDEKWVLYAEKAIEGEMDSVSVDY